MFFVNCIVTFFDLTKPASSIVNPAAIQKTKNPLTKNNKEFKIEPKFRLTWPYGDMVPGGCGGAWGVWGGG